MSDTEALRAQIEALAADWSALATSEGVRRDTMARIEENVRHHKAADARSRMAQDHAAALRALLAAAPAPTEAGTE